MKEKKPFPKTNTNVYTATSKIPKSGTCLFANVSIKKGDLICTYGGKLIDNAEAMYQNPTYTAAFENGKGYKLIGDNIDGDMGHYANSVHPLSDKIIQNARFDFKTKKYLEKFRGRFDVIAIKDINVNEEIIVKYGDEMVDNILKDYNSGLSKSEIKIKYSIDRGRISKIIQSPDAYKVQ